MITFMISIIPASLFIFAVHTLFQEGNLLESIGDWMGEHMPDKWNKPFWSCPVCMASVWGSLWFMFGLPIVFDIKLPIVQYVPYVFCLCGLNYIINKLISKNVNVTIE